MSQQIHSVADRLNLLQDLDDKEQRFHVLAQDLCNQIFILIRSAGLYDLDNQALEQPYEITLQTISDLYGLLKSPLSLRVNDGHFFLNRRQVKIDFTTFQNTRYLLKVFEYLDMNELAIDPQITREDLVTFLASFIKVVKDKIGRIQDYTIPHIKTRKLKIGELHALMHGESSTELVCTWYANAVETTRQFYLDSADGRIPEYALLKRVTLNLIQLSKDCTPLLTCLHLLSPKSKDAPLHLQSVEAAGLCAALGEALKLSPQVILTLTSTALQVFQGWTLFEDSPLDIQAEESTAELFKRLNVSEKKLKGLRNAVVRELLNLGGINESVIQRAIISYEAQRSQNQRSTDDLENKVALGLPSKSKNNKLYQGGLGQSFLTDLIYGSHLFIYLRRLHGPSTAAQMLKEATLSSFARDVFSTTLGDIPVGSLVTLSDGRKAVVTRTRLGEVKAFQPFVTTVEGSIHVEEEMSLRGTSPVQIKAPLDHNSKVIVAPLIFYIPRSS